MDTKTKASATLLGKALVGIGLGEYAEAFSSAGYEALSDLGGDEADVRSAIVDIVPADKPGVVNRIVGLWRGQKPAPDKEPERREPVEIPSLPAGSTWDLSQPTVTVDDVEYTIPNQLSVTSSDAVFAPADWMIIAKRTKILYGINMDRAVASTADDSARAQRPALTWMVPDGDDFLAGGARSKVTNSLSYTSSLNNLVHNRIMDASLAVGAPFVSLSARVAREEAQAKSEMHKRLFMTGMWRFEKATLKLPECTAASPAFVSAIKRAVDRPAGEQFDALRAVFDVYGHAVPQEITVGAELYFQSERNTNGHVEDAEVKSTVQAAVSAKCFSVSGGAGASFQDGEGKKVEAQDIAEAVSFTCVGGDTTLGSNPQAWSATTKDPNSWAVIGRTGMTPLVDWLAPALKARVMSAWEAGLKQQWGGRRPPVGYASPDLDGKPFSMTSVRTERYESRAVKAAGKPQAYAELVSRTLLSDPAAHNLLWRLVFAGKTTEANGRGRPLYWLVTHNAPPGSGGVLASLPNPQYNQFRTTHQPIPQHFLSFLPESEMQTKADAPETSQATWTLTAMDPSGYYGNKFDNAYVITHVTTGKVLGPVRSNTSADLVHPTNAPMYWSGVDDSPDKLEVATLWICDPETR